MTAAGSDNVNRDPGVQQQGFVRAAKIMEAQRCEAELSGAADEFPGHAARGARPGAFVSSRLRAIVRAVSDRVDSQT